MICASFWKEKKQLNNLKCNFDTDYAKHNFTPGSVMSRTYQFFLVVFVSTISIIYLSDYFYIQSFTFKILFYFLLLNYFTTFPIF